ncbi:MAG: histidine phosphatase family protein [Pseudomonadota bacterium]
MTIWHWIRHGPTHEKTFVGWRDVPADLSDTARIARLIAHLPSEALVISSDLKRSIATADALTQARHRRLPHHPDLREFNFGAWDGLHFADVSARDPVLSRAYWEEPGDVVAPEGESWNQAAARAQRVVDKMNEAYPDDHIIAVAHFGIILTQVQRALEVSAADVLAHKIDNLSVTTLAHHQGKWDVKVINHRP